MKVEDWFREIEEMPIRDCKDLCKALCVLEKWPSFWKEYSDMGLKFFKAHMKYRLEKEGVTVETCSLCVARDSSCSAFIEGNMQDFSEEQIAKHVDEILLTAYRKYISLSDCVDNENYLLSVEEKIEDFLSTTDTRLKELLCEKKTRGEVMLDAESR